MPAVQPEAARGRPFRNRNIAVIHQVNHHK
jgi:hypothetical protein